MPNTPQQTSDEDLYLQSWEDLGRSDRQQGQRARLHRAQRHDGSTQATRARIAAYFRGYEGA